MWTQTYLLLLAVRAYFALSPSYIHPDENFQGPEIIAGNFFGFPHHRTWEFTSNKPVRSIFPLWPVYGLPMLVLQWICSGIGMGKVPPRIIYYSLRVLMFLMSFVLEDWALHELVQSPRHRRLAVALVASSYVTWTYQTHTFSNSVETLAVLWSLVMIQRILDNKQRSSLLSSAILGLLLTFGVFNRITFPAFVLIPCLYLLQHFLRKPLSLLALSIGVFLTTSIATALDTSFYNPSSQTIRQLFTVPTFTPLNSLLYNSQHANLAIHGLHPHYQHLVASLPLLLGPALYLLIFSPKWKSSQLPLISALSGILFLSFIPHQEPRFLLPAVPLILASVHLPRAQAQTKAWLLSWAVFNAIFGVLMGIYHQGGVIPSQIWLGQERGLTANMSQVYWWRTYSPPVWLLDRNPLNTTDLMGIPFSDMQSKVEASLGLDCDPFMSVGLVAPFSSVELDAWLLSEDGGLSATEIWHHGQHLNLDDLEIAEEGILGTLTRVIGRRGLIIWNIKRKCGNIEMPLLKQDW